MPHDAGAAADVPAGCTLSLLDEPGHVCSTPTDAASALRLSPAHAMRPSDPAGRSYAAARSLRPEPLGRRAGTRGSGTSV